jgi:hypothetical protein
MLGRMSVLTTQISRRSMTLRALEMSVHTSAFELLSHVMERRKGQRKDTPYGIAFVRKLFDQFASEYAANCGLKDGSDDGLEIFAKGMSNFESVSEQKH